MEIMNDQPKDFSGLRSSAEDRGKDESMDAGPTKIHTLTHWTYLRQSQKKYMHTVSLITMTVSQQQFKSRKQLML